MAEESMSVTGDMSMTTKRMRSPTSSRRRLLAATFSRMNSFTWGLSAGRQKQKGKGWERRKGNGTRTEEGQRDENGGRASG
jgi:hypothetical protein